MAYDNETYLQSLANQRADVDRQVANTRQEVARQRDAALGQLTKLPGAVRTATNAATAQAASGLQGARSSADALNLGSLLGDTFAATGAEVRGRMGDLNAAYDKTGGLLQQGFHEQADQRIGQVDSISKQLFGDIEAKRAAYIAQRQAEDRQRALQEELARRQEAAQRAALAQQNALAQEQMGQASQQAQLDRDQRLKLVQLAQLHEAIKNRSVNLDPRGVVDLYFQGAAPAGMSLSDYGKHLGIPVDSWLQHQQSGASVRRPGHQIY